MGYASTRDPERDKYICEQLQHRNGTELAEELGLSRERIRQIALRNGIRLTTLGEDGKRRHKERKEITDARNKRDQYIAEQALTKAPADIAAEIGIKAEQIRKIARQQGVTPMQTGKERPWFYPQIRELAHDVNQVGISKVCRDNKLNSYWLKEAFKLAGFGIDSEMRGGRTVSTKIIIPETESLAETLMKMGLGLSTGRTEYERRKRKKQMRTD